VDLAKYRSLFLEEATEHLAEMSRALLCLEKDPGDGQAIDLVFRMAHSIKGMAGSLDYDAIGELSHRLEDRMASVRAAGRVEASGELALLFRGLEELERMVEHVRETGEAPAPVPGPLDDLSGPSTGARAGEGLKKKR
jgi:two-component system, chemotaxis family, sensor kinase CheA